LGNSGNVGIKLETNDYILAYKVAGIGSKDVKGLINFGFVLQDDELGGYVFALMTNMNH
jgi:hypothetical protein